MQEEASVTREKDKGPVTVLTIVSCDNHALESSSFGMDSWLSHFSAVGL